MNIHTARKKLAAHYKEDDLIYYAALRLLHFVEFRPAMRYTMQSIVEGVGFERCASNDEAVHRAAFRMCGKHIKLFEARAEIIGADGGVIGSIPFKNYVLSAADQKLSYKGEVILGGDIIKRGRAVLLMDKRAYQSAIESKARGGHIQSLLSEVRKSKAIL